MRRYWMRQHHECPGNARIGDSAMSRHPDPYTPELLYEAYATHQGDLVAQLDYILTHGNPPDQLLALCEHVRNCAQRARSGADLVLTYYPQLEALWSAMLTLARFIQENVPDHEYRAIVAQLGPVGQVTVQAFWTTSSVYSEISPLPLIDTGPDVQQPRGETTSGLPTSQAPRHGRVDLGWRVRPLLLDDPQRLVVDIAERASSTLPGYSSRSGRRRGL